MTGRRSVAALLAGVVASLILTAAPVAAQPSDPDPSTTASSADVRIEVASVTPWIGPDGDWTAALTITGAPADAEITYSIRQPPTGSEASIRQALAKSRDGDDEPKVMRSPVTQDLATLTDPTGETQLRIGIRSGRSGDRDRILIPNSGVYPVVVGVTSADGTTLAGITLYLNRLPASSSPRSDPFRLGIIVQPPHRGGFDDAGELDVTAGLRSSIDNAIDTLEAGSGLPLQLAVSPESMVALTQSNVPGDLELVERLVRALGSASVVRVPWANLQLEGWATTGSLSDVQTSLIDGQQALFARLQRPTEVRVWPPDTSVGPAGVELLTKLGIAALIVDPDQLAPAKPPSGESGFSRPFRVVGKGDAQVSALSLDPDLQSLLASPDDEAGLAAHQMITSMVGSWLADDHQRGAVLRIDDRADAAVVAALLGDLSGAGDDDERPIDVVDPTEIAALPAMTARQSGRDATWTRQLLAPSETPTVSGISRRLAVARPLVDDYASIVPAGDPVAARDAIVIQRSLDRRVAPGVQESLLDDVTAEMRADLRKVSASESRSLTVTSRRTSIPLRFTNDLGRPIRVRLRLQSPRLDFLDGDEQSLTLSPGLNRLDVAVEVRASGQFPMQADLIAPNSNRVLASTRQRVRSTTFSGVGLMLSGGALLFLVIWWSRTLRRRDRDDPIDEDPTGVGLPGPDTEGLGATPN